MSKYFIITVDTEGDNLWKYKEEDSIGSRNAEYIPKFQQLCEKYGFKPVYLTNYEMALSDFFVNSAKTWLENGKCEIGIHLHAWNNPPIYDLQGSFNGNPYLIEYPEEVMRAKFNYLYNLLSERFGIKPVSHRAGRWAMNETYFKILEDFEIQVDCSHTPGKYWKIDCGKTISTGPDFRNVKKIPSYIGRVLEVPMTLSKIRLLPEGSWKHKLKSLLCGKEVWLRSAMSTSHDMKCLINRSGKDYNVLEFMIHSSELMPGGSPYFPNKKSIDSHFKVMEDVFSFVSRLGYQGITLKDYKLIFDQE